ncbi:MAG: hypothetical protein H7Y14_08935 [Burkholderiales bacterium]|nr:hypothetical protein [Burkholderiales bacterium]
MPSAKKKPDSAPGDTETPIRSINKFIAATFVALGVLAIGWAVVDLLK